MADIKPISTLDGDATVAAGDQLIINKSQGGSYKTSVILPGNFGPQISQFISLDDLSNVSVANAAIGQVLKWDGTTWVPGTGGGASEYVLPVASAVTLGGVRIGDNINVSVGGTGIISVDNFVNADTGGTFQGSVSVIGTTTTTNLQVTADASISGTLDMGGLITFAEGQTFPGGQGAVTSVNNQTGTVVLDADDVGALPINGSTAMTGTLQAKAITASGNITTQLSITANGTVAGYGFNGQELDLAQDADIGGSLTVGSNTSLQALAATDINATSLDLTGAFAGTTISGTTGTFSGQVTVPVTPTSTNNAASKGYVDSKIIESGAGTVERITAGNGLETDSGNPITTIGTIFVEAADATIDVAADGIKAVPAEIQKGITFPVTSVNDLTGAVELSATDVGALPNTGGTMTGNIVFAPDQPVMDKVTEDFLALAGGTMTGNIVFASGQTFPSDIPIDPTALPDATDLVEGVVFLSDAVDSTLAAASGETAATPLAVSTTFTAATAAAAAAQTAQNTADLALPKAGGTITGSLTVDGSVTATKFVGDGSELTGITIPDPITYKGTIDCTTDAAPTTPTSGDLYLNLVAGEPESSWTGLTTLTVNQFVIYKTNTWENGAILDGSAFVTLSTEQSITGAKTFTQAVTIPDNPATGTAAANKNYVDAQVSGVTAASLGALDLSDTNNQTMSGNLTMGGTSVIVFNSNQTFPSDIPIDPTALPDATDNTEGVVFLSDAIDSSLAAADGETAATPLAVKTVSTAAAAAQTTADAALPKTGGTISGDLTITGSLTGVGGDFTGLVSGITPTEDANFTTKEYVDAQVGNAGTGTVTSVNDIEPDAQGNVTLTASDVTAWALDGNSTLTTDVDITLQEGSGNALRFMDGEDIIFRCKTNEELVEFWDIIKARADIQMNQGAAMEFLGPGVISMPDGQGSALKFEVNTNIDGTPSTIPMLTFNSGAEEKIITFQPLEANEVRSNNYATVSSANFFLKAGDSDALDFVDPDGDIYQRFNTANESVIFQKPVDAQDVDSTKIYTNQIFGGTRTAPAALTVEMLDNNNIALDFEVIDAEGSSNDTYMRFRTIEDDEAILIYKDLRVNAKTNINADGTADFGGNVTFDKGVTIEGGGAADITLGLNPGEQIFINGSGDEVISLKANNGTVTATKFVGDGSELTGVASGAPVQISPTAPAGTPEDGELWWDSTDGILYVYYTDVGVEGDDSLEASSQWVDVRPGAGQIGVESVNGKTGDVTLGATDVGALPVTGGTVTGTLTTTGVLTTPDLKLTGITDFAVPYFKADGTIAAMTGVEYNEATQTLKISSLESPSTGDIIVNAEFQATGPAEFSDTVSVAKAASFLQGATVTGTLTATNLVGDGSGITNLPLPASTTFKGSINATTGTAPSASDGDVYSNTTSGTADSSYTGIAGDTLAANQLIFYADSQWQRGGIEEVSDLVTLATDQTISGAKTFSTGTNFSTISVSSTSTHGDTATFTKSNGRAIEVKTGSTLKGYWTGAGDIHATQFVQSGSTATNTFLGDVSMNNSLIVSGTTSLKGSVTLGDSSSDNITISATAQTHGLYPSADNNYGIGSSSRYYQNAFLNQIQFKNLTGLSQLNGSPVIGTVAMFAGILYYYGTGNQWYMLNASSRNPPA